MADNQITPFQLTDQFTMDNFNQRINETNTALQKKTDTSIVDQIENDVNVLESRMNEFASLPEGSTSGNAELVDIRVGQDGTVYSTAGNAVRSQVTQLKQDLGNVATIRKSKNILNPDDILVGKFITTDTDGSILYKDTNPQMSCVLIPVEIGETYTVTGINYYVTGFSESLKAVRQVVDSTSGEIITFTIPSTNTPIKYVSVSWKHTKYPSETFMIVKGNALPSSFEKYGEVYVDFTEQSINNIKEKIDNGVTEFYVGYSNNNNQTRFANVVDCLWKVAETGGKKVIHIASGTYDIYAGLGGRDFVMSKNTTDNKAYDTDVQPWISDCEIIGEGKVILNFKLDADIPYENYWLFSAINVHGNFRMENVELYAENCRYAIHDESKNDYPNTTREYVNCIVSHVSTREGTTPPALGCGFSENTRAYYRDCIFICDNSYAWTCHANKGTSLDFNSVCFINKSSSASVPKYALRISNNGMFKVPLRAILTNCFTNNGILTLREEDNDNRDSNTRIDLINTKLGQLDFRYTTNIYEPVTSYDTITGTMDVLVTPNK